MILNIRGTSGSGKSTLVVKVMDTFFKKTPIMINGRRQPYGYWCRTPGQTPLYVPGHYEIACGGCDTIKTPGQVYDMIRGMLEGNEPCNVLYEGIMVQDISIAKDIQVCRELGITVLGLKTPIDECLAAVRSRRAEKGNDKPLDPTNTISRAKAVTRKLDRLADAGVKVKRLSREDALAFVISSLR